jgi:hypothetical protein
VLNDSECEKLRDIERQFQASDPEFTQSFHALRRVGQDYREPWRYHERRAAGKIAILIAALFGSLMLVGGSLSGAFAFAAVTGLTWVAWRSIAAAGSHTVSSRTERDRHENRIGTGSPTTVVRRGQ